VESSNGTTFNLLIHHRPLTEMSHAEYITITKLTISLMRAHSWLETYNYH